MIKSTGTSVSISTDGGRTFTSIACDQIILSPQDTGEMGTLSEFSRGDGGQRCTPPADAGPREGAPVKRTRKERLSHWRTINGTRCNGGRTGRRYSHLRRRA